MIWFFQLSSSATTFWNGSPFFLNVTVFLALLVLLIAIVYFSVKYFSNRMKIKELAFSKTKIRQVNKSGLSNKNPNRPMAVVFIPQQGVNYYSGPVELLSKLQHVTPEVLAPLRKMNRIELDPSASVV